MIYFFITVISPVFSQSSVVASTVEDFEALEDSSRSVVISQYDDEENRLQKVCDQMWGKEEAHFRQTVLGVFADFGNKTFRDYKESFMTITEEGSSRRTSTVTSEPHFGGGEPQFYSSGNINEVDSD